jgi:hypothetical protein
MTPSIDPRDYDFTLATLFGVKEEIDAMERCGATGEVLDEGGQHAWELEDILSGREA